MTMFSTARRHTRLIGALMLREATTRFGREWGGFLWVFGEPLIFCVGVLFMWGIIKPEYEHGIRVGPFIMTGYLCLTLLRHMISGTGNGLQANVGLLHHRQVTIYHVMFSRNLVEFFGGTGAFVIVYIALYFMGEVNFPTNWPRWLLLLEGWFLCGWVSMAVATFIASLILRFEFLERAVAVASYTMIPASGCFTMAAWVPAQYRDEYLMIPLPHSVEMVRGAVFGEFVHTYYNPLYAFAWGAVLLFAGLVFFSDAKDRMIID